MIKVKKLVWSAYGDVNPLGYNGVWVNKISDNEYTVVTVDNLQWKCSEEGYKLGSSQIDITDTCIDLKAVRNFTGNDREDKEQLAIDIISYYGHYHCNGEEELITSRKEVRKYINNYGIVIHRK